LYLKEAEEILFLDFIRAKSSKDIINKLLSNSLILEFLYFGCNEKLIHFCLINISWAILITIIKDDRRLFRVSFDIFDQSIESGLHHFLLSLGLFQLLLVLLLFHLLWANSLIRQSRQSDVVLLESIDGDAVFLLGEFFEELHRVEGWTLCVESLDHFEKLVTTDSTLVDGSDLRDEIIEGDASFSCAIFEG
jgi:hypothetical protein